MHTERPIEQIDRQIINHIHENGLSTPKDISENRLRENVVRLRCHRLAEEGLVKIHTHDIFVLTDTGEEFVEADSSMDEFRESIPSLDIDRITDFSQLDPEDLKWRNRQFLDDRDHKYDYGDIRSYEQVNHSISAVRNGDLNRVMREFPRRKPLSQQCAHWTRAIVGLHFFHDANHRTAMSTLNTLLKLNDLATFQWSSENENYLTYIFKSKLIRKYIIDVRFDNLWCEDELYLLWHRYFINKFYEVEGYSHHSPNYERYDNVLDNF